MHFVMIAIEVAIRDAVGLLMWLQEWVGLKSFDLAEDSIGR
jgi:hypothetical protein